VSGCFQPLDLFSSQPCVSKRQGLVFLAALTVLETNLDA
jgi:hypothetical protein